MGDERTAEQLDEDLKRYGRATRPEIDTRASTIAQLLTRGTSRQKIVQIARSEWGVSARQTDNYIALAREELRREDIDVEDRDSERALMLARIEELYQKAHAAQDYKECHALLKLRLEITRAGFRGY